MFWRWKVGLIIVSGRVSTAFGLSAMRNIASRYGRNLCRIRWRWLYPEILGIAVQNVIYAGFVHISCCSKNLTPLVFV
ncbi:hypothetical protein V8F06_002100 [Rhypophila decipiens]